MLTLIKRENYIKDAELIDFNISKDNFKNITNTSEQMHFNIADDYLNFMKACKFSFLNKLFEDEKELTLSI